MIRLGVLQTPLQALDLCFELSSSVPTSFLVPRRLHMESLSHQQTYTRDLNHLRPLFALPFLLILSPLRNLSAGLLQLVLEILYEAFILCSASQLAHVSLPCLGIRVEG